MKYTEKEKRDKVFSFLLFVYFLFLIRVIVFKYSYVELRAIVDSWQKDVIWEGLSTANFTPFKTIRMYIRHYDMPGIHSFSNLFGNILIFIPFGFLLSRVHPVCRNLLVLIANSFLFVLGIEVFQLFSAFGAFDVDDIMLNVLGTLLGGLCYHLFITLKKRKTTKKFKNP